MHKMRDVTGVLHLATPRYYRVIRNECRVFNNLSYTIRLVIVSMAVLIRTSVRETCGKRRNINLILDVTP